MHPQYPPFQYSKPYVPFDWKELYGLNLEDALARNDFRVFGAVASSLAFGDIESPFRQGGVPEDVVRLASVQQYLAQYLLHMQDVLMHEIELARANPPPSSDIQALLAERDALRKQLRIERAKRQTDAMMLRLTQKQSTCSFVAMCVERSLQIITFLFRITKSGMKAYILFSLLLSSLPQRFSKTIAASFTRCRLRLSLRLRNLSHLSWPYDLFKRPSYHRTTPNPRNLPATSLRIIFLMLCDTKKFTGQ